MVGAGVQHYWQSGELGCPRCMCDKRDVCALARSGRVRSRASKRWRGGGCTRARPRGGGGVRSCASRKGGALARVKKRGARSCASKGEEACSRSSKRCVHALPHCAHARPRKPHARPGRPRARFETFACLVFASRLVPAVVRPRPGSRTSCPTVEVVSGV